MKNLLRLENGYNLIVQLDYLAALITASLIGRWNFFFISLVVSLILGWVTVKTYIKLQKKIIKESNGGHHAI
jgi:hypothetical protein